MRILAIAIIVVCMTISSSPYAGLTESVTKGVGGFLLVQGIKIGIEKKAGPFLSNMAVKKLKNYIINNPSKTSALMAVSSVFVVENYDIAAELSEKLVQAGLFTRGEGQDLINNSKDYRRAYAEVEATFDQYDPDEYCDNNLANIYSSDLSLFDGLSNRPVREYNTGAYRLLKSNEVVGDDLEHDHIPSYKAVLTFVEKRKGSLTDRQTDLLKNNSTTIEVHKDLHKFGRTYKGKNLLNYEIDSKSLKIATYKDFSYHLMNSGMNMKLLEPFMRVFKRNASLCLYEE